MPNTIRSVLAYWLSDPFKIQVDQTFGVSFSTPGIATLPSFATFSRASSGESVRFGSTSLLAGLLANQAGVGRALDANEYGISIDGLAGGNLLSGVNTRDVSTWATAGANDTYTASGLTGPDGTGSPKRVQIAFGGGYSKATTPTGNTGPKIVTHWARSVSGTTSHQWAAAQSDATAPGVTAGGWSITSTWAYYQSVTQGVAGISGIYSDDSRDWSLKWWYHRRSTRVGERFLDVISDICETLSKQSRVDTKCIKTKWRFQCHVA